MASSLPRANAMTNVSVVGSLLREARRGFSEGWNATFPDARRRFITMLLAALAVSVAISAGSALLLSRTIDPGPTALDMWLRAAIDPLIGVHSAVWLGALTSSILLMPLVALLAVWLARRGDWRRAVLAVVAYLGSKAVIVAGWWTWDRPRPADVGGGELVPASLASYPSGHTLQAVTVLGLYLLWWGHASGARWERALAWTLLIGFTVLVGVSRIRIGAHYPTDVIGGALLGAVWLAGMMAADRR